MRGKQLPVAGADLPDGGIVGISNRREMPPGDRIKRIFLCAGHGGNKNRQRAVVLPFYIPIADGNGTAVPVFRRAAQKNVLTDVDFIIVHHVALFSDAREIPPDHVSVRPARAAVGGNVERSLRKGMGLCRSEIRPGKAVLFCPEGRRHMRAEFLPEDRKRHYHAEKIQRIVPISRAVKRDFRRFAGNRIKRIAECGNQWCECRAGCR